MLIDFQNVSKWFPHSTGRQLLRTHIARWFGRVHNQPFCALRDISFQLDHGESLAIVGSNGAGKSTLLSLAAGLTLPDRGKVQVNGRIAALLQLGAGFHMDLTGAENLVLNAALLGLSKRKTNQLFDSIVDFSGIGEFIDDPLRTYSSGMIMRLAFSIAIQCEPDILMIDEILGVGDASFQEKSKDALVAFRRAGKSLLFVSHSAPAVREMCDRAIWIDHGAVMMDGRVNKVLEAYQGLAAQGLTVTQQGSKTASQI
jgi:ABC-type polysaccharide/polyol phosphate transport system ATPase subunit